MKLLAIDQAQERFDMAQVHYDALHTGLNYDQFRPVWTQFLLALNATFVKLEKGAAGCGKSQSWINQHKTVRRSDPLLSYLKQARNSDEHGLTPVSGATPGSAEPKPGGGGYIISVGRIYLTEVVDDRFGDRYPVPETHLGEPIKNMSFFNWSAGPWEVGKLGLAYKRTMIDEARQLPVH